MMMIVPLGMQTIAWSYLTAHGAACVSCAQLDPPSSDRQTSLSREPLWRPPISTIDPFCMDAAA
jgi:hypothetical protein